MRQTSPTPALIPDHATPVFPIFDTDTITPAATLGGKGRVASSERAEPGHPLGCPETPAAGRYW